MIGATSRWKTKWQAMAAKQKVTDQPQGDPIEQQVSNSSANANSSKVMPIAASDLPTSRESLNGIIMESFDNATCFNIVSDLAASKLSASNFIESSTHCDSNKHHAPVHQPSNAMMHNDQQCLNLVSVNGLQ